MITIFSDFFFHGKHEIYFKNLSITSMSIMEEYGLRVFRFCDKIAHLMRFFSSFLINYLKKSGCYNDSSFIFCKTRRNAYKS